MTEVTKSVKETAKREAKRKRQEEAVQKKEKAKQEAERSAAATTKSKKQKATCSIFDMKMEAPRQIALLAIEDLFSTEESLRAPVCIVGARNPSHHAADAAFDSRLNMFLEQFQSSPACVANGRTFMRLGASATKLTDKYAKWMSKSMPCQVTDGSSEAKIFVPGLVGVAKNQVTFGIVETASLRRCCFGSVRMVIASMADVLQVLQDSGVWAWA